MTAEQNSNGLVTKVPVLLQEKYKIMQCQQCLRDQVPDNQLKCSRSASVA